MDTSGTASGEGLAGGGGRRIVVGLSGGVDSSLAAALLEEAGWEVVGVTLQMLPGDGAAGVVAAQAAAMHLGIAHHVLACQEAFAAQVLRPCWDEYAAGRTPNPCLRCNPGAKFASLLEMARRLGAAHVATGHYARILASGDGRRRLCRGVDLNKDQSYFLAMLTPEQLAAIVFPLGGLTKEEVRGRARARNLPNADRTESQDACFATDEAGLAEFLRRHLHAASPSGVIMELESGRIVGRHDGIHQFTIGQRRGTRVALGQRAWVQGIDAATATIRMTTDPEALLAGGMRLDGMVWHRPPPPPGTELQVLAQSRYRQAAIPGTVQSDDADGATAVVRFDHPVAAIAPGQGGVLYQGDEVIGAGRIVAAIRP
jgi:tRNA-specific 2-thiouridylase